MSLCSVPGCEAASDSLFMCKGHWKNLPERLRAVLEPRLMAEKASRVTSDESRYLIEVAVILAILPQRLKKELGEDVEAAVVATFGKHYRKDNREIVECIIQARSKGDW